MNRLYDMIHEKVKAAVDRPLTKENYDSYLIPLWFEKADELKAEMEAEGLEKTVATIQEMIDYERKTHQRKST